MADPKYEQKRDSKCNLLIRYKTPKGTWGKWTTVKPKHETGMGGQTLWKTPASKSERPPKPRTEPEDDRVSIPTPIYKIPRTPQEDIEKEWKKLQRKKRSRP